MMRLAWTVMGLMVLAGCPGAAADGQGADGGTRGDGSVPVGVVAEGVVVPVQFSALALPLGGILKEVLVKEGSVVEANQLLVRMETREVEARMATARAELLRATAALGQARAPARTEELAIKQAHEKQVEGDLEHGRAELARLEKLRAMDSTSLQDVERGRSSVLRSEAALAAVHAEIELMRAGPRRETVAVAEAGVAAARAVIQQAEAMLALLELRAPFAGTVAYSDLRPGEFAAPGMPIIRIADLSHWIVRTEDLTELAVVNVKNGAPVVLTFDAVPGLTLHGKVASLRPFGERKKGDMTYTATIEPDVQDSRLRWNMTASLRILPLADQPASKVTMDHLRR
jgi:HlyD family secretion protein